MVTLHYRDKDGQKRVMLKINLMNPAATLDMSLLFYRLVAGIQEISILFIQKLQKHLLLRYKVCRTLVFLVELIGFVQW